MTFDAILVVSFGGPEGPDDVEPFLGNVLRGRRVPPERVHQVAARYLELGGISPLNGHNRALVEALDDELMARSMDLPVYWGNRNWHPFLEDTVRAMAADGVRSAAAFVTSAYSSYSSCRQYLEDIERARLAVGAGAPAVVKLRPYFNHPGFIEAFASGLISARAEAGPDAPVLMSAHSIPAEMAATCDYERQLRETARLVSEAAGGPTDGWSLVFQSRSGPPTQPWLGPDVNDVLGALPAGLGSVIVVPLGFVSDHMEVVYDLDRTATGIAANRGLRLVRSATPGGHPGFTGMICDLVAEAASTAPPASLGVLGSARFPCPPGCCPMQATASVTGGSTDGP